ncbi:hypothetical protein C8Q74DRAFT_410074 [Fomes fomentarius]|nr:hypothetical protein C8Q74DRAFT_410074 [Fomes fomentarius]
MFTFPFPVRARVCVCVRPSDASSNFHRISPPTAVTLGLRLLTSRPSLPGSGVGVGVGSRSRSSLAALLEGTTAQCTAHAKRSFTVVLRLLRADRVRSQHMHMPYAIICLPCWSWELEESLRSLGLLRSRVHLCSPSRADDVCVRSIYAPRSVWHFLPFSFRVRRRRLANVRRRTDQSGISSSPSSIWVPHTSCSESVLGARCTRFTAVCLVYTAPNSASHHVKRERVKGGWLSASAPVPPSFKSMSKSSSRARARLPDLTP